MDNSKINIKAGLFEHLHIADAEQVHSQVITWLLSEDSPLSVREQSHFLTSFLGMKSKLYQTIDSIAEFQGIDILIRADDDLFVIENKFAASQHADPLDTYQQVLCDAPANFWMLENAQAPTFYFLTLTGEAAGRKGWTHIGYGSLLSAIVQLETEHTDPGLSAYARSLSNLMGVVDGFNEDHTEFLTVFTDGSLKKWDKQKRVRDGGYTAPQAYVEKFQLETILQQIFMERLASGLSLTPDDVVKISEKRGIGLLEVRFGLLDFKIGGRPFFFGVQLHGKSLKINLMAVEYMHSGAEWISEEVRDAVRVVAAARDLHINHSRTRACLSISRTCPPTFFEESFEDLAEWLKEECDVARTICTELSKRVGCVV